MRIGHYAPEIWAYGGIASYIRRLSRAQCQAGHDVVFLSKRGNESSAADEHVVVSDDTDLFNRAQELGLDILHLHKEVSVLPLDRVPTIRTMHGNQASCPSGTRYLAKRELPCDRAFSVTGCLHGRFVERCGSRRPRNVYESFGRIRKELDVLPSLRTLSVSRFLKDQMVLAGHSPDAIHVLYSPAPKPSSYTPPPKDGPVRFVFAGRIVPEKGLAWLLRSLAATPRTIFLDVVGSGYDLPQMQQLAETLGISDRVKFYGWLLQEELYAILKQARALVFPSVWHEPAGLVTLEAASLGRPVVASSVGGIPEYATLDYSLLVQPNDVDQLTEAIMKLATDWSLARQLGYDGLEITCKRFAMDHFLKDLDLHYRSVLSEAPKGIVH